MTWEPVETQEVVIAAEVRYSTAAFKRAGFLGAGGQLLLETSHDSTAALAGLEQVISASNEFFAELEMQGLWAQINRPVPTPEGPLALVTECEPARALTMMLDRIARGLEESGISGKLRPATRPPADIFGRVSYPALGAMVMLPIERETLHESYDPWIRRPSRVGWMVDPTVTQSVVGAVMDWILHIDGRVQVSVGGSRFVTDPSGVSDFVVDALPVDHMIRVSRSPDPEHRRVVEFSQYGCLSLVEFDVTRDRRGQLIELTDILRAASAHANNAFIRELSSSGGTRAALLRQPPKSPLMEAVDHNFWMPTHLEGDYVYDACVTQVLTSSQLEKIHELPGERWSVEDLDDRYLVRHLQPELWFDTDPRPFNDRPGQLGSPIDEATLAQARADFGDAIMTPSTLETHPPNLPYEDLVEALGLVHLRPRSST